MGDASVAMKASQAVFSEDNVAYLGGIITYKGEMAPYANDSRKLIRVLLIIAIWQELPPCEASEVNLFLEKNWPNFLLFSTSHFIFFYLILKQKPLSFQKGLMIDPLQCSVEEDAGYLIHEASHCIVL